MNFKEINIGELIKKRVVELDLNPERICQFFKCTESEIEEMYELECLDTGVLLKWSKLLDYDFFRIYSQHLILYSPPSAEKQDENRKSQLPQFRKSIYTKEIIDFILHQIETGEMTKNEVINQYKIPKTTLYKWISKQGRRSSTRRLIS